MISLRSGLVGLAFVAMGLTAAVERLAEGGGEAPAISAETHAGVGAGSAAAPQSGRDDALRLTRRLPETGVAPKSLCKIAPGAPRI